MLPKLAYCAPEGEALFCAATSFGNAPGEQHDSGDVSLVPADVNYIAPVVGGEIASAVAVEIGDGVECGNAGVGGVLQGFKLAGTIANEAPRRWSSRQ